MWSQWVFKQKRFQEHLNKREHMFSEFSVRHCFNYILFAKNFFSFLTCLSLLLCSSVKLYPPQFSSWSLLNIWALSTMCHLSAQQLYSLVFLVFRLSFTYFNSYDSEFGSSSHFCWEESVSQTHYWRRQPAKILSYS
jgi:hypothetical protein